MVDDNDFGFSFVDEEELKQYEKELENKLKETNIQVTLTADEYKQKLLELYNMILPLLKNLSSDPSKAYIYWPDRVRKIEEFTKKITNFVNNVK